MILLTKLTTSPTSTNFLESSSSFIIIIIMMARLLRIKIITLIIVIIFTDHQSWLQWQCSKDGGQFGNVHQNHGHEYRPICQCTWSSSWLQANLTMLTYIMMMIMKTGFEQGWWRVCRCWCSAAQLGWGQSQGHRHYFHHRCHHYHYRCNFYF